MVTTNIPLLTLVLLAYAHLSRAGQAVPSTQCFKVNKENGQRIEFIADETNLCHFYKCIRRGKAVMMKCAKGSSLNESYKSGRTNPCTIRYFGPPRVGCMRTPVAPGISNTTPPGPRSSTIIGGIPIPTENNGESTRPPLQDVEKVTIRVG